MESYSNLRHRKKISIKWQKYPLSNSCPKRPDQTFCGLDPFFSRTSLVVNLYLDILKPDFRLGMII